MGEVRLKTTRTLPAAVSLALMAATAACSSLPASETPAPAPTQASTVAVPAPTPAPRCPEPTEGTLLLTNEWMGYCLLYPDDLFVIEPLPAETCLVPEVTPLLCHNIAAMFGVSDAGGRSAGQVADERLAQIPFDTERSSLTIGGEPAELFADVPAQGSLREVLVVHDDRLYSLRFGLPDPADPASVERFERLYDSVIESFTFLPTAPPPEPGALSESRGSAVVAFVKDGDVQVWEETTGESRTVFDAGDVVHVELSGDGQLVAFVRRASLAAALDTALWVVGRDGGNPRELVSADQLRARLNASENENVELPCVEWVPGSHRLLYSGRRTPPAIGAACLLWPTQGLSVIDADRLVTAELVPAEESLLFEPAPDGDHIGLVDPFGLEPPYFVEIDAGLSGQVAYLGASGAPASRVILGWTQDSTSLLVAEGVGGQGSSIWRVPVDGSPAEPVIALEGEQAQLAPDGSVAFSLRSPGPLQPRERFATLLPGDLGPLAVRPDPLGLSWSPGGTAYVVGDEAMSPLCQNATQTIEVCEASISFGEPIQWLEWLDRERFLYLTYVPKRLMLGSLDGSRTLIAEDPDAWPDAGTPTIAQSFAAVASTCRDDSEFVSDVTVPDGTPLAPGAVFRKTWRIRNTGDCAWGVGYRLAFLSGDRMSGPRSAPLEAAVPPGEEVEVSILLLAPQERGAYRGHWTMFAPDGTPFGTAPYVAIQVD